MESQPSTSQGPIQNAMSRIWQNRNISNTNKMRLVKSLVFSIFLYSSTSGRFAQRIKAIETCCWRKMLSIPQTARLTNTSIPDQLRIKTKLSTIRYQRALSYFGHNDRRQPDIVDKLVVVGKKSPKKQHGQSPSRWFDQIKKITGLRPVSPLVVNRMAWK